MRRQQEVIHGPQNALNSIENKSRYKQSLRHINYLRHKPANQLSQSHLSLRANSPKCIQHLCHQIAASGVVEIAITGTRVQHRRPNVGHVKQWVILPVFVGKNNSVSQLCKKAYYLSTLSTISTAKSLYL